MKELLGNSLRDIVSALRRLPLVCTLGWQDVRQRYNRSLLGAFWLTISIGVMIASIGFVFGHIFDTPMRQFLPFLAVGLIFWNFMSTTMTEGCHGFVAAEAIIKQQFIPISVYVFRVIWRNLIILAHNIIIVPLVLFAMQADFSLEMVMFVPGLLLLLLNLGWISIALAIVCTRYRDIPQIVTNFIQVMFYLTPVIWTPDMLAARGVDYMLWLNPFFHFIQIVRAPLLGQSAAMENWLAATFIAVAGWCFTLVFFGKYRRRVAYWL